MRKFAQCCVLFHQKEFFFSPIVKEFFFHLLCVFIRILNAGGHLCLHVFVISYDSHLFFLLASFSLFSRSGELRTQKLKSQLVRTQSLNVLPSKPGVGQYIAIHTTLTARDFFLAYFYTSGPFTCIFSKTSLEIFPVLAVANTWFLCRPAE